MLSPLDVYSHVQLLVAAGFMAVGGFTKGAVGFALPLIAIAGLGSILPAHTALAALILPVFVTNVWQTFRQGIGPAWETFWSFRVLNAALFVTIAVSAQLAAAIPGEALFLLIGVVVSGFAVVQLLGWKPPKPERGKGLLELAIGVIAGFSGGVSGVWGPPILMYLIALETPKTEQVRAQGVFFLVGSVILTGAHLRSGVLNAETTPLSLALVVPATLGMALGLTFHDRLDQKAFRRLTLAVLCIAGLNLLRRGLF